MYKVRFLLLGISLALLQACAVKKYMPKDEFLYVKGKVKLESDAPINDKKYLQQKVDEVLFPTPNAQFLGTFPKLHFHYKAQREKPGFFSKFMNKRIGEEPVYFSAVNIENTEEVIINRLENFGHFNSRIAYEVKVDSSKRQKSVFYTVYLKEAYTLQAYQLNQAQKDSLSIYKEIEKSLSNTLINSNNRFDLNLLKEERERIHVHLKEKGYYNFNPNFLLFEIDTNQYKDKRYDLYLRLKTEVPKEALQAYKIKEVNVYPNERLTTNTENLAKTTIEGVNFWQDSLFFKPKRLRPFIAMQAGDLYQPSVSRTTSRRLGNLNTYKFVTIEYEDLDSIDTQDVRWLRSKISLSPLHKRSLRFELQGVTKSNNFTGPNLGLTYINRNLFKAGEQLRINATAGYERQFLSGNQDGLSSLQLGLRSTLSFPRLLFPIDVGERFKYSVPKTNISLGVDLLNRTNLYALSSFSGSFGYSWEGNRYVTHSINPLNIEYLSLYNTSEEFEEILDNNPFLRRSFEQQFIAGLNYSFTYNAISDPSTSEGLFFNATFESAGNTLDVIAGNDDRPSTFLDLAYAQFVKGDVDIRYHYALNSKGQKLVGRLFAGAGLPYANSTSLPFVKQYFAGGPYSVRGFRIRSLGPGTYQPDDETNSFFDQAGDIRLEANLEYRFPIISYLKGALFADAGNVWLMNENPSLPGGKFTSSFLDELGFSTGVGLRVDVVGFVIRFDFAAPIKRPAAAWDFEYDQSVLNFAIGYPF